MSVESSLEMRREEVDTSSTAPRNATWAARALSHAFPSTLPGPAAVTASRESRRRCSRSGASGSGGGEARASGDSSPSRPATAGPVASRGV
ncbi:hypothetical protein [Archangium minus]|uniref:hypothetical protein n=1 Tax=Archangium minus TaxID=83450 RepID=UPI0037BEF290